LEDGWAVRGTTRDPGRCEEIEAAGIEAAVADPDRLITVLELVGDVAVVCWLLGSAQGDPDELAALHGPRLERLLEEIVDTPVRGVVCEAAGSVPREDLEAGERALREAGDRWRIPYELVSADPLDADEWTARAKAAVASVLA
jgi:hypothetical protein